MGDPRALLKAGRARLTAVIAKASNNHQGATRPSSGGQRQLLQSSSTGSIRRSPGPTWPPKSSPRCVAASCPNQLARHAAGREEAYRWVDVGQIARTLPGVAEVSGPVLAAAIGAPNGSAAERTFKSFVGLRPKVRRPENRPQGPADEQGRLEPAARHLDLCCRSRPETGPTTRADLLPCRWSNAARTISRQLRRRRPPRQRFWAVMRRGMPYVICDTDGTPVTPAQAKQIIAEQWTVPPRSAHGDAARRSRRWGRPLNKRIPGMSKSDTQGVDKRGDLPHQPIVEATATAARQTKHPA